MLFTVVKIMRNRQDDMCENRSNERLVKSALKGWLSHVFCLGTHGLVI